MLESSAAVVSFYYGSTLASNRLHANDKPEAAQERLPFMETPKATRITFTAVPMGGEAWVDAGVMLYGSKMDLNGKAALITGGSRGIGAAIGLALAKSGAQIAICDVQPVDETERLSDVVRRSARKVPFFYADVTDFHRAHEVVSLVVKTLGRLGFVVRVQAI